MIRSHRLVIVVSVASLALSSACGDDGDDGGADETTAATEPPATDAEPAELALTSPAFQDGGELPNEFSCNGAGSSPPLAWSGVPDGTTELALTVVDPDAGNFVHWVTWGIDPGAGQLAADTGGAVDGATSTGSPGWLPACPPSGDPHAYVFTLYALQVPPDVQPGATLEEFQADVAAKTLATAELTGTYASP